MPPCTRGGRDATSERSPSTPTGRHVMPCAPHSGDVFPEAQTVGREVVKISV